MSDSPLSIAAVQSPEDLASTIHLFQVYCDSLNADGHELRNFAVEMSAMPGKYSPPAGALFLARLPSGEAVGCVGLRPLPQEGCCEMKRLYVEPKGRSLGIGKALAEQVIHEAKRLEYRAMRLDTMGSMLAARQLYERIGFVEIAAYHEHLVDDLIYLELDLTR